MDGLAEQVFERLSQLLIVFPVSFVVTKVENLFNWFLRTGMKWGHTSQEMIWFVIFWCGGSGASFICACTACPIADVSVRSCRIRDCVMWPVA